MTKEFHILTVFEIPLNSYWTAADGGDFGHYVIGFNYEAEDVIVHPTVHGELCNEPPRRLDFFKLQYRYTLVE